MVCKKHIYNSVCHSRLQTRRLNLEPEAFKDINFVEPGFKAVPPKVDLIFFPAFVILTLQKSHISFVRKQIRCKKLQEYD